MSYDISLRPTGENPDEFPTSPRSPGGGDIQRLEATLARLRAIDPEAEIEVRREDGLLIGFVVAESERLPYLEVGPHDGMLSMSMGSSPVDLYRSLHTATTALDASGYTLFDHQLGCDLQPAALFREFMLQHRRMWDSPEAFEHWLHSIESSTHAGKSPSPQQQRQSSTALTVVVAVLLALWGAYKLHKAGYF